MKKTADITTKATPSNVVNTMLNPLQGVMGERYVPKFFRPTALFIPEKHRTGTPQPWDALIFSTAALALTYGGGALAYGVIKNELFKKKGAASESKDIQSFAEAGVPRFAPNPWLADTEMEQAVEKAETADLMQKGASLTEAHWWKVVLPVAAVAMGLYAGSRAADKITSGVSMPGESLPETENLYNKELFNIMKSATTKKEESGEKLPEQVPQGFLTSERRLMENVQPGSWDTMQKQRERTGFTAGAQALLLAGAVALLGVGGIAAKAWQDERDPRRQKIKKLQDYSKRLAISSAPPTVMPFPAERPQVQLQAVAPEETYTTPDITEETPEEGADEQVAVDQKETLKPTQTPLAEDDPVLAALMSTTTRESII